MIIFCRGVKILVENGYKGGKFPCFRKLPAFMPVDKVPYGLIEIKLGGDRLIKEGANSLKALSEKTDTDKMKKAAFLMVLTGTGDYAYRRPDGVYVVPIGCLKD